MLRFAPSSARHSLSRFGPAASLAALGALLAACSSSEDPPPASQNGPLSGTWTISVSPLESSLATCGPIGLDGAELILGNVVEKQEGGLTYSVYYTEITGLDLESKAEAGESMLDVVFVSDGSIFFETGMYYWPAGDLTVALQWVPPYFGSWDENGFEVVWGIEVYAGDVITAVFDELTGEMEDVIDTFDAPLCESTIVVTATPQGIVSAPEESALTFVGGSAGATLTARLDSATHIVALSQAAAGSYRSLGEFPVQGDGSFSGRVGAATVVGRFLAEELTVTFERLSEDGADLEVWTLNRIE